MRPPCARRNARRRRGAALVEMAAVFPLLLTVLLGIVEIARLGMASQLLTVAARDGCRVAVLDGATAAQVQARVDAVLAGSGIAAGAVAPTPADWQQLPPGRPITVTLSVPYRQVSWLPLPTFLSAATIRVSATLSSEKVSRLR